MRRYKILRRVLHDGRYYDTGDIVEIKLTAGGERQLLSVNAIEIIVDEPEIKRRGRPRGE